MVDASLQDGSEVFRVGGGKSVLIESNNSDDTNSVLLIPHSSEGRTCTIAITLINLLILSNRTVTILESIINLDSLSLQATRMTQRKSDPSDPDMWIDLTRFHPWFPYKLELQYFIIVILFCRFQVFLSGSPCRSKPMGQQITRSPYA